jgi:hypothetical protein
MQRSIDTIANFKPGQILYIEHQGVRLYAEVIQIVSDRKLCWVRPLALVTPTSIPTASASPHFPTPWTSSLIELEPIEVYDLRQGADLVCPQSLFQAALDTEVLPILAELNRLKPRSDTSGLGENNGAHERLREFVRLVWQTNPTLFNSRLFN